jgi:Fe-S cluster biogenesis protein NfuA/NifU-like protein involved in Fe-S cluster formation
MTSPHPAIAARLGRLRLRGELSEEQARAHGCSLVTTAHGAEGAPDHIELALLVGSEGAVHDARYRTAAQGELLAAYDVMAELCLDRPLADIAGITPRQVDAALGGSAQAAVLHLGADADTPYYVLTKAASRPQAAGTAKPAAGELPWPSVGLFEKVRRIESVLDQHVRAALASDGGGLDLVDLKDDELFVQYHGACGSCSSSIGGTLQFVQDSLNNHLGTALTVRVASADAEGPSLV